VEHHDVVDRHAQLVGRDLRKGSLLTLPVRRRAVMTVTFPVGSIFTVALSQRQPASQATAERADLAIRRNADPSNRRWPWPASARCGTCGNRPVERLLQRRA